MCPLPRKFLHFSIQSKTVTIKIIDMIQLLSKIQKRQTCILLSCGGAHPHLQTPLLLLNVFKGSYSRIMIDSTCTQISNWQFVDIFTQPSTSVTPGTQDHYCNTNATMQYHAISHNTGQYHTVPCNTKQLMQYHRIWQSVTPPLAGGVIFSSELIGRLMSSEQPPCWPIKDRLEERGTFILQPPRPNTPTFSEITHSKWFRFLILFVFISTCQHNLTEQSEMHVFGSSLPGLLGANVIFCKTQMIWYFDFYSRCLVSSLFFLSK